MAIVLAAGLGGCTVDKPRYDMTPITLPSGPDGAPPDLAQVQAFRAKPMEQAAAAPENSLRLQAMRTAALSFGAQAGLARRSWEIGKEIEQRGDQLDRIYAFEPLVVQIKGGGVVAPPVIEEGQQALNVASDGQSATSAAQVLRIIKPAKIVSVAPTWRTYLQRSWSPSAPPNPAVLPRDDMESSMWAQWVAEGWRLGVEQAEEIFQQDLNRLVRDHVGMLRYRKLVADGIVKELYLAQADLGVTGGDDEMRIGDRLVRITTPVRLAGQHDEWEPIIIEGAVNDIGGQE